MAIQQMLCGAGGKVEVVETLSGNSGTWTAPAGVTNIETAVIVGSYAKNATWSTYNVQSNFYWTSSTAPSQSSVNAALQAWSNAHVSWFNSGAPGERSRSGQRSTSYTLDNGDTVSVSEGSIFYHSGASATIKGTLSAFSGNGTINYNGKWAFKYLSGLQVQSPGTAGSASSMFGYSAAGASIGGSPTTVTATNISVTPGQGYSWTKGTTSGAASGSLTLTYYQ